MRKKKTFRLRNLIWMVVVVILVVAAIRDQLRQPPQERTWQGSIAGIPYDFRLPTLERLRNTFWNKNTSQVLVPQAFGVGWTVNFYPLVNPIEKRIS